MTHLLQLIANNLRELIWGRGRFLVLQKSLLICLPNVKCISYFRLYKINNRIVWCHYCLALSCGTPPTILNTNTLPHASQAVDVGETVTYECLAGYESEMSLQIECLTNQEWSQIPSCESKFSFKLKPIAICYDIYYYAKVIRSTCHSNHWFDFRLDQHYCPYEWVIHPNVLLEWKLFVNSNVMTGVVPTCASLGWDRKYN